MSVDVLTMLASAATILVALFGGFAWMIRRMDAGFAAHDAKMDARFAAQDVRFAAQDARFAAQDERMDARFAAQDEKMDARFAGQDEKFDARFDRVEDRLGRVEHELTDVKIAIARLEGPEPRLIQAR